MGGCSSKPKTAEFEGLMDLQEGKPQEEVATMSLEAETIGVDAGLKGTDRVQESSECGAIQVLLAEMEEKHVFVESENLAERNEQVTSAKDASELQLKPMGPQDETLELPKDPAGGREELESQKEVYENKEQILDDGAGHKRHCEHIEKANEEFAVLQPAWEDPNAKSEAMEEAAAGVSTSTSVDMKIPCAKALDQQPLEIREITDSTCIAPPATTAAVCQDDLPPMVGEQAFLLVQHEEQMQAKSVDAADGTGAEIFAKSQAEPVQAGDPRPMDGFQLNGETMDTTLVEGDYACGKINSGNDEYLSSLAVVSEEPIHTELPENSAVEVQGEKLNTDFICNGGQLKSDVSSTLDQVTAPQVTATTENPEAQFVPVKEPAEPAFRKDILAQEISTPDIDEVWEKLASEFERQENLARVTP